MHNHWTLRNRKWQPLSQPPQAQPPAKRVTPRLGMRSAPGWHAAVGGVCRCLVSPATNRRRINLMRSTSNNQSLRRDLIWRIRERDQSFLTLPYANFLYLHSSQTRKRIWVFFSKLRPKFCLARLWGGECVGLFTHARMHAHTYIQCT